MLNAEIVIPGDETKTLTFCIEHFIEVANKAIDKKGSFFAALSGGSTPKALFEKISHSPYREQIDWSKVHLFWSDERSVPPSHPDSNYRMAMEAGLKTLPIPFSQIHRMHAEENIEANAKLYEKLIQNYFPFDLMMLGMGEDGHTASLFPGTKALEIQDKLVAANFVPEKNTMRMTLTYPCINASLDIVIYVLGSSKRHILAKIFTSPALTYPIQQVGTKEHKALWIIDEAAAKGL